MANSTPTPTTNGQASENRILPIPRLAPIPKSIFIYDDTEVPEIKPVLKIRDATLLIEKDFMYVTGLPKAGKTSIVVFIIITALLKKVNPEMDTLEIKASYCQGKKIFYIDTEQPKSYTKRILTRINTMLGINKKPNNLYIINLREITSYRKKRAIIFKLMKENPGAHLWIVDGVADLLSDVNDAKESNDLTGKIMAKCDTLNTSMILFLHESRSNERMRGHAGAEGERKAGSVVRVKKNREQGYHSIECLAIREGKEFDPVYFHYSEEKQAFVTLNKENVNIAPDKRKKITPAKLESLAFQCTIGGAEHIPCGELINRIRLYDDPSKEVSESTAYNRLEQMKELGVIAQDETGKYYLCKKEKDKNQV